MMDTIQKGKKERLKKEVAQGIKIATVRFVKSLYDGGFSVEDIAKYAKISREQVMKILEKRNNETIEKTQDEIIDTEQLEARRLAEKQREEEIKDYTHGGKSAEYKGREKMIAKFVISLERLGYHVEEIAKCVMQPEEIVREIIEKQESVMILGPIKRADDENVNKIFYEIMDPDIKEGYNDFIKYRRVMEYIYAPVTVTEGGIIDDKQLEAIRHARSRQAMGYMDYSSGMKYAIRKGMSGGRTISAIEINMYQLGYSREEIVKVIEMAESEEVKKIIDG
jgi:hypothetical protein